jgi:hypothetical protein
VVVLCDNSTVITGSRDGDLAGLGRELNALAIEADELGHLAVSSVLRRIARGVLWKGTRAHDAAVEMGIAAQERCRLASRLTDPGAKRLLLEQDELLTRAAACLFEAAGELKAPVLCACLRLRMFPHVCGTFLANCEPLRREGHQ